MSKDNIDEQNRLIAEFEQDEKEAALAEFEGFLQETQGKLESSKSGLLAKLKAFPDGGFPVSLFSQYYQPYWTFQDGGRGKTVVIYFDSDLPGSGELKRAIVYHLVPSFTPFARIKAFASTKQRAYEYRFIEEYVLKPNKLTAIPEHIAMITTPMLNQALDDAKMSGQPSHYSGLFFTLRFWLAISAHRLIPENLRLPEQISAIDTRERHQDVFKHFQGSIQAWLPFSEEELEKLVNNALFWLEQATPRLLETANYLMESGLEQLGTVRRVDRQVELELMTDIEIDGKRVMNYSRTHQFRAEGGQTFRYFWISEYAQAVDKVRNAVFVFVALVTGLRRNEMGALKFEDVTKDEAGRYWIDVTRFKTSIDPNYNGESDSLPLPMYVGQIIDSLKKLRSIHDLYRQGFIFQTAYATVSVTQEYPDLPDNILLDLEDATGIERIHAHRFRKTIAEILIHRSERNIDVIRLLFGHHSYAMTLRYISRNPYLVRTVAVALEQSYSKEFHEIVTAVRDGGYSGPAAERLHAQISKRPDEFKGKRLKVSILVYVSYLLTAGTSVYIGRTAVGTYCVTGEEFDEDTLPPCLAGRGRPEGRIFPDPSNCQIECRNAVVLGKAEASMRESITFYETLLENGGDSVSQRAKRKVLTKIDALKRHLGNLHDTEATSSLRIPLLEVS